MDLHLSRSGRLLARLFASSFALIVCVVMAQDAQAEEPDPASSAAASAAQPAHPREKTFMKRQWGVEVLFVRQTAAGYMLEFRYKVLDAEKAKSLFVRQTKPLLTHVESGAVMVVPTPAKTGALRNSNPPIAGHTYWMYFANPGMLVQSGEHVNIQIGDFLVEGLTVE